MEDGASAGFTEGLVLDRWPGQSAPTGRKIRFATNRLIRFSEAYYNSTSQAFDLTAGEFDLNASDKNKSAGKLYPASQLIINKNGELQFELRKDPWKLVNVVD